MRKSIKYFITGLAFVLLGVFIGAALDSFIPVIITTILASVVNCL